jgi:hypothetical protein
MSSREEGMKGDPLHEEGMKGNYRRNARAPTRTESSMDKDQFAMFRKQERASSHVMHVPNED